MGEKMSVVDKIWAYALLFMGVAMFFAIPGKVAQIQELKQSSAGSVFFMKCCFYLVSIMLTGGGLKKIMAARKAEKEQE